VRGAIGVLVVAALGGCDLVFPLRAPDPLPVDAAGDGSNVPLTYAETILADLPKAYWRLGDSSANAKDETSSNPGMYIGAATHPPGAIANDGDTAATFGSGLYVDVGSRLGFEGEQSFTIEAWVNPITLGSFTGVVSKDAEGSGGNLPHRGYHLYVETTKFGFERSDGILIQDVNTGALTTGRWTHVVVTFDGSRLRLYKDGAFQIMSQLVSLMIPQTSNSFVIGARDGGTIQFFDGSIDEVAIYDHPLTDQQIDHHHAVGLTGQ
jgi:hypothetical protein